MTKPLFIIATVDNNNGIGKNGKLPWNLKKDSEHFEEITTNTKNPEKRNMVIMGRVTWESIPENIRPLPNKMNVVLSRKPNFTANGATIAGSLDEAIALAGDDVETVFAIGGMDVYTEVISREDLAGIYLTRIDNEYDVDAYFPGIPGKFSDITPLGSDEEDGVDMLYLLLKQS